MTNYSTIIFPSSELSSDSSSVSLSSSVLTSSCTSFTKSMIASSSSNNVSCTSKMISIGTVRLRIVPGNLVNHIRVSQSRQLFSNTCSLVLLSSGSMKVRLTGKRENKIGNGLEFPCIVTIKFSEHVCSSKTVIKDFCGKVV